MSEPKKILLVVLDGMGDRACPELRGLTPLQYVRTPNLDWFVEHGYSGLCDPIAPGVRAGSDTAHLAILGYDPYEVYTGRGPLEAMGAGMDMQPGDIALRCNFATVDSDMNILDRRAGRIRQPETDQLAEALDGMEIAGVECTVKASTEHRAVLLLRGDDLSPDITDCDPGGDTHMLECLPRTEEAEFTAQVVNAFLEESHWRLKTHTVNRKRVAAGLPPANMLVPRGAGAFPSIDPFPEKYGMRATCVAGVGLIKGICKACGFDIYPLPPECNGGLDSDLMLKTRCALEALEEYDFVLMNIKAPDVAGHDGNAKAKAEVVKRIDAAAMMLRYEMPEDLVVVFTCDHSTPCSLMDHGGDSVPITVYTEGMVWDDATEFSETGCAKGGLMRIRSRDIVPICLDLSNRTTKFGS
ncbi:MAG: 2,3-bisphosphoglycerate-independent phosphoglycerate mutase [Thermoplasmata archaeon]|nr:2,3-bisphosphoglycerate-independent phosphoglycerate mutase [Thermoplasmata archaeon]